MAPSYHSEHGNLEHWLLSSIFETRQPYFSSVFATIKSPIAIKNIGDWGRCLGSYYFRYCPQSITFSAAIQDLVVAKSPLKRSRRISKLESGGSCWRLPQHGHGLAIHQGAFEYFCGPDLKWWKWCERIIWQYIHSTPCKTTANSPCCSYSWSVFETVCITPQQVFFHFNNTCQHHETL